MTILYFTATGNCLEVAKEIGGNLLSIPQMIKEDKYFFEDDVVGIIFPVYVVGMPRIVENFINKATISAKYTFAIGTYGNIAGPAMINLKKLADKKGLHFNYMTDLLMVDNYLQGFEMQSQINMLPKKKTEENLKQIVLDIKNYKDKEPRKAMVTRTIRPLLTKVLEKAMSKESAKDYIVDENCTLCGVCKNVCPTKNIQVTDKVSFSSNCECCLSCIQNCPSVALHVKGEKSDVRYRNAKVSLGEIINSNNQF